MHNCLNCDQPLNSRYCADCGQKAATHRYSLHHFLVHDLVHGIWHLDRGILFTLKALMLRPGRSVREFIQGRRANYFNYITLLLLILGAAHFLEGFLPMKLSDILPESNRAAMSVVEQFSSRYPKLVPLITIPLSSVFSYLWFRKAGLNGTEHMVLNTYKASGEMLLGLLFSLLMLVYHDKHGLLLAYSAFSVLTTAYTVWFFCQFFSTYGYTKTGLFLRSLMVPISIGVLYALIGFLTAMYYTIRK